MIFGYARVSTMEQNLNRQLDALKIAGSEEIIQEKITGTKADRPAMNKLLDKLRKDDIVLVFDLTRLSRSTKDLFTLVELIEKKGANIKSLKESWLRTSIILCKLEKKRYSYLEITMGKISCSNFYFSGNTK